MVSLPEPPSISSLPEPPSIQSLPPAPTIVSAPALQKRWWASKGNGAFTGKTLMSASRISVSRVDAVADGADLDPEVIDHDPAAALFGGPDGMAVIVPIIALAARLLRPGGKLGIEHDDTTADQVVAALDRDGTFGDITARRDLTGRPRFVTATRR